MFLPPSERNTAVCSKNDSRIADSILASWVFVRMLEDFTDCHAGRVGQDTSKHAHQLNDLIWRAVKTTNTCDKATYHGLSDEDPAHKSRTSGNKYYFWENICRGNEMPLSQNVHQRTSRCMYMCVPFQTISIVKPAALH